MKGDYTGRLPPGAAEDLADALKSYRKSGLVSGVEISFAQDGCQGALAQAGAVYPLDAVPALPLPGCDRSPCCACSYLPAIADSTEPAAEPQATKPRRGFLARFFGRR